MPFMATSLPEAADTSVNSHESPLAARPSLRHSTLGVISSPKSFTT